MIRRTLIIFWGETGLALLVLLLGGGVLFVWPSPWVAGGALLTAGLALLGCLRCRWGWYRRLARAAAEAEQFKQLVEGSLQGVLVISPEAKPLFVNAAFVQMLGFPSVEAVLRLDSILPLVDEEHRAHVQEQARRRAQGEEVPEVYEVKVRRCDGTPLWLLNAARRMRWGDQWAIQSALIDVTPQKQTLEALKTAKARAEEADRSKSQFLAAASHDLRQPLQALDCYLDVLRREVHKLPPAQAARSQELLRKIRRSLEALTGLLDGLLDLSRLEAGVIVPRPRPVDLDELLDILRDEFDPVAEARGLEFAIVPDERSIISDPQLLGRVLRNLLSNALRYTEKGHVFLYCQPGDRPDHLALVVEDSGRGIPDSLQERVFEAFYRGDLDQGGDGMGLGLAIVQRLAGLLGHELQLESAVGVGTRFTLRIPLAHQKEETEGGRAVPMAVPTKTDKAGAQGRERFTLAEGHLAMPQAWRDKGILLPCEPDLTVRDLLSVFPALPGHDSPGNLLWPGQDTEGRPIIIIDDQRDVREGLGLVLEASGFPVLVAASLEEAIRVLEQGGRPPALILADCQLGEERNGAGAIKHLQSHFSISCPGLLITGDAEPERLRELIDSGFPLLHKPVSPDVLVRTVVQTLLLQEDPTQPHGTV